MPYLEPANEQQLEAIKQLYFYKDPQKIEDDVDALIEWIDKQPHLPNITDRKWLKHFLIGRKNNLQRTKKVIEQYFTIRAEIPDLDDDMTSEAEWIKRAQNVGKLTVLPKLTPEGYRVQICRSVESNSTEFNPMDLCKGSLKVIDFILRREPIYGFIFVIDIKYFTLSHLLNCTPSMTKNLMRCMDEAMPLRITGVHYVNPPKFVARLVNFVKMFMSTKIQNRVVIHEDYSTLYEYIPKDILPEEYGGTAGPIEKLENEVMEASKEDDEWYRNFPKADLSKRPAQSKSNEPDMSGTFKKLNID